MITLYDIIIIIVIVLIITPLIIAIIITSRRPKFGRLDTLSNKSNIIGSGPEDDEIGELNQMYGNITSNLSKGQVTQQKYQTTLQYIDKSHTLIAKLKEQLDEYGKPGVMPISNYENRIADTTGRYTSDNKQITAQCQDQLNISQEKIDQLQSDLERLRTLLSQNNIELEQLRKQKTANIQSSDNTKLQSENQCKNELEKLKGRRKIILDNNKELNLKNEGLLDNNESLQKRLKELETVNTGILAHINDFTQRIKQMTDENTKLNQLITEQDAEILNLKKANFDAHYYNHDQSLEDNNQSLEDNEQSLGDIFNGLNVDEHNQLQSEQLKQLTDTITSQSNQLEQLERDINVLRLENIELKRLNFELQTQLTAESAKVAALEQKNVKLTKDIQQCQSKQHTDQVGSDSNKKLYKLINDNTQLVNNLEESINTQPQ